MLEPSSAAEPSSVPFIPPAARRRQARSRPRQLSDLPVLCSRKRDALAPQRSVLTHWSTKGARLRTRHALGLGDWVQLQLPSGASAAQLPRALAHRAELRARVVWEGPGDPAAAEYSYGIQFGEGWRERLAYASYCALPLLAVLFFALGTLHVVLLKTANVHYFWYKPLGHLYSLLISFYILSRFAISAFYRPAADAGFRPTISVVIACKNEEDAIGRTIDWIYASDYPKKRLEVICVNDGSTDRTLDEMRDAARRHAGLRVIDLGRNLGKRHGMAAGARAASGEILVYVDSDSFVRRDTLARIVQDFQNPDVGAVCGHAYVQNAHKNFLTRMQEVRYYVAFRVVKAAESLFGSVACCSGCLAAYRRSYVMEILDTWLAQRFLGTEATFGDDRSLTNFMLRRYRVLYNSQAACSTLVPEGYRQFFKQQLRWKKSWVRETFIAGKFMWRRHPLAAFFFYLGGVFPLISPLVAFNALVYPLAVGQDVSLLYVYGATLMAALYGLYYLGRVRSRLWVYGVAFSFFYMFVLVWQTYYALVTVRRNHWGTR